MTTAVKKVEAPVREDDRVPALPAKREFRDKVLDRADLAALVLRQQRVEGVDSHRDLAADDALHVAVEADGVLAEATTVEGRRHVEQLDVGHP